MYAITQIIFVSVSKSNWMLGIEGCFALSRISFSTVKLHQFFFIFIAYFLDSLRVMNSLLSACQFFSLHTSLHLNPFEPSKLFLKFLLVRARVLSNAFLWKILLLRVKIHLQKEKETFDKRNYCYFSDWQDFQSNLWGLQSVVFWEFGYYWKITGWKVIFEVAMYALKYFEQLSLGIDEQNYRKLK